MAGQLATASFDHQHPQAPDNRMQRPNLNARNEISPWIRWEGMQVYVVQEQKTYQLVGGTGNEHWQEIAAGGGASNFVGQFPTFDDLPGSGSPGDYAYVGTGDDFVQYNWDQIAGEWRLNSAETKVSDEDFFLGRVPSEPDRVMFSMRRNSIIYSTGGSQSISPDRMANYVFTGENVTLENVNYDIEGNEEFHITNRTGSNLTILGTGNFASGLTIPAGHMASFKSSNDGWVQSFVNEEATFSDTLDSVNARISRGPDGLEVLSGVFDKNTGKHKEFKEVDFFADGNPMSDLYLDGKIYIKRDSTYMAMSDFLETGKIHASVFGISQNSSSTDNFYRLQEAVNICAKIKAELVINSSRIEIDRGIILTDEHSGLTISGSGGGTSLRFSDDYAGTTGRTSLIQIRSTETGHPRNISIYNLDLDGNKDNITSSSGSGILIYAPPGSPLPYSQNIKINNLRVFNFSGNGITCYQPGVIFSNIIAHDNEGHGISTNPPAIEVIMDNIISYRNNGYGIDISGGSAIVTNAWSFENTAGGMKHSVDTFLLKMTNLFLYENDGVGFQQTGASEDLEILINGLTCRRNGGRGLSVRVGRVKRLDNIILVDNNLNDSASSDNQFENCSIGSITIFNHKTTDKSPLQITGLVTIENFNFIENKGSILIDANVDSELVIGGGVVKNNDGVPFYVSGSSRVGKISARSLKFIDTTQGGTQGVCVDGATLGNSIRLYNPDFTENPGPITGTLNVSNQIDLQIIDPIGFSYVYPHGSASYTLKRRNITQSLRSSGNGEIVIPPGLFNSGEEIEGVVMSGSRLFTPGAGVSIIGGPRFVSHGQKWSVKYLSEADVVISSSISHGSIEVTGANVTLTQDQGAGFIRFTGNSGNINVLSDRFFEGQEIQGEIEGGAKTFVAGAGVTLRYPDGGTNVAPTNSRFFIKFKSPNDAQLTIVPSTIPENTYDTFIPEINGSSSNPTVSYTDQFGDYALIDKLCHFEIRIDWLSMSGGTGNIRIPLPVPRLRNTANGGPSIAVLTGLSTSPPIYACYIGFNNIGFRNAAGNEISLSELESEGVIALSGTYIIGE